MTEFRQIDKNIMDLLHSEMNEDAALGLNILMKQGYKMNEELCQVLRNDKWNFMVQRASVNRTGGIKRFKRRGIWEQVQQGTYSTYNRGTFNLNQFKEALGQLYERKD